ncbi:MAG: hypothetical protein R3D89_11075 [Sphingomonadaceae bacterium]
MAGSAGVIGQGKSRAERAVFVATILLGSFLLFLVQPLVARMALPRLGGAPNVWNSAMIVYQALLLAGYAYAHWLSRLAVARQAVIHIALLALFALTLPIALYDMASPAAGWEVLWVPLLLMLTVGPVFFIVSAQAPLMQRWFAADPDAGEPWALYAASNLGSFAGLLAYPLLLEPMLPLAEQSTVWSIGYAALVLFVAACAWLRRDAGALRDAPVDDAPPVTLRRKLHWLALAAVPSGLMLSTTTHLTTDIFAMPLLWVIPLGLYLLSFVFAFADTRWPARAITTVAPAVMLLAGGLTMISRHTGSVTLGIASVALLFVVAVALHSRLYELRPPASQLTLFYLVMSLGGALGGAFTAILAPVIFDWVWEHPILVVAAAILMPLPRAFDWSRMPGLDIGMMRFAAFAILVIALFLAWLLHGIAVDRTLSIHRLGLTLLLTTCGLLLMAWRWKFLAVLALLMVAQGGGATIKASWQGIRTRSYFGVYTIIDYPVSKVRALVHGSTLHGQQSTEPEKSREPSAYYGPGSGAALVLQNLPPFARDEASIGVLGLGAGTLACFAEPGQRWQFFEIDEAIERMSRDGTFTYYEQCTPDAPIVLGDARLEVAKAAPGSFDVLLIDAFSSDSVPLHLITKEAVGVYLDALAPDGVLLIHISNRYIELEPVVAAIAREQGLVARARHDNPAETNSYTPTSWIALARDPATLEAVARAQPDKAWEPLVEAAPQPWTDDYASILPYIRWKALLGDL